MRYQEHAAAADLASRVECLWLAEDDAAVAGAAERVLPDGCVEWILHLGAEYARIEDDGAARRQPQSFLVGATSRPLRIAPTGPVRTLGVRFRPGGAREIAGLPLDALRDAAVASAELWGAAGRELEDAALSAASEPERRAAIERFLRARLARSRPRAPRIDAAVTLVLASRGRLAVAEIARRVGWSPRQLERELSAAVGLGPKTFTRVIRFQNLLRLAGREPGAGWSDLAARCGYADQAHLVREFRALAGVTPASGPAAGGELARYFVAPERLDALLAGRTAAPGDVAFLQDGARPRA